MKIAIVGDGKVGYTLTHQLLEEGHDIVVIDSNPEVLEESLEKLDVMVVNGNGATLKTQGEADVANSDLLIAATSADEINLLCCILAKKLGCRHTICRMRNPDYAQSIQFMRDDFGLSMTINPELTAAREIFRMLQFPSFLKRDSFAKGRVEIVELKISSESSLVGKRLEQLSDVLKGVKVLVCAVERGDDVYIPDGSFNIQAGDKITVTAPRSELEKTGASCDGAVDGKATSLTRILHAYWQGINSPTYTDLPVFTFSGSSCCKETVHEGIPDKMEFKWQDHYFDLDLE